MIRLHRADRHSLRLVFDRAAAAELARAFAAAARGGAGSLAVEVAGQLLGRGGSSAPVAGRMTVHRADEAELRLDGGHVRLCLREGDLADAARRFADSCRSGMFVPDEIGDLPAPGPGARGEVTLYGELQDEAE